MLIPRRSHRRPALETLERRTLLSLAPTVDTPQQPFVPHVTGQPIQAEDFDAGGEGVAYHDIDPANRSSSNYRPDAAAVDLGAAGGITAINYTAAGEWTEYTVNIPAAGLYTFTTRIANNAPGAQFHFDVDGLDATGPIDVPNTGGFGLFRDVVTAAVPLRAGTHVIRLAQDRGAPAHGAIGNIDWFRIDPVQPPTPAQTPFLGRPFLPGDTIQAEDFDAGGESVASHDLDPEQRGGAPDYRPTSVDINVGGSGRTVGYTAAGEWLEYAIDVAAPGAYRIETRLANNAGGAMFRYDVDGAPASGTVEVRNTGSFGIYQIVSSQPFTLAAGPHVLRLHMETGSPLHGAVANFDWLRIVPV
jgi:hypothetical protein